MIGAVLSPVIPQSLQGCLGEYGEAVALVFATLDKDSHFLGVDVAGCQALDFTCSQASRSSALCLVF